MFPILFGLTMKSLSLEFRFSESNFQMEGKTTSPSSRLDSVLSLWFLSFWFFVLIFHFAFFVWLFFLLLFAFLNLNFRSLLFILKFPFAFCVLGFDFCVLRFVFWAGLHKKFQYWEAFHKILVTTIFVLSIEFQILDSPTLYNYES